MSDEDPQTFPKSTGYVVDQIVGFDAADQGGCEVFWGSHGCGLDRDHEGPCECGCCHCENHPDPDSGCVGRAPFYGPDTRFWGEDAQRMVDLGYGVLAGRSPSTETENPSTPDSA